MIKAVIFDLDGVIVTTDDCHYRAWKQMADVEGIYFDRKINEKLRGVSRMKSLEIILERAERKYSQEEKEALAYKKNEIYKKLISELTERDVLPGVKEFLSECKRMHILTAIGSSSKNAKPILERIGMFSEFDAVVDGNDISKSKPDPEVFVKAAQRLGVERENCLVVEDACAGVDAGLDGGMRVLAVGSAAEYEIATYSANSLEYKECFKLIFQQ